MEFARRLFVAVLIATLPRVADANTIIDPGQTFALGGEQKNPVRIEGRNNGPVAIELLRRRGKEQPELIGRVMPGKRFMTTLPAGHTALARNTSNEQPAVIRFVFNGQIDGLSMRYEPGRR
jgi:hypothetical protein